MKIVRFTKGMGKFLRLGTLLGRILEASSGLLGASWAVLEASEPIFGPARASWGARLASRGPRGPFWRLLGAF